MGSIGMPELIVIFLVVLLLFGSKRLPELAQGLGKGIREFKRATNELRNELDVEPIRRDFEKEMKGNLDEIKKDPDKPDKTDQSETEADTKKIEKTSSDTNK